MSQAGAKKREKNLIQKLIGNITPFVSGALSSVGSTPEGFIFTTLTSPAGTGLIFNKAISGSANAVDTTGRFLSGDISANQWRNEMYNNYIKNLDPKAQINKLNQNINEVKDKGLGNAIKEEFKEDIAEIKHDTKQPLNRLGKMVDKATSSFRTFFNSLK